MADSGLLERTVEEVSRGRVFALLPDETQAEIRKLTEEEIREGARRGMTRPQPGDVSQAGRLLLNPCLAVHWLSNFETLDLPRDLRVFEPCSGSSDPILLATEIYTEGAGRYVTVNLNRPLAREFRAKIGKIRVPVTLIEEDATQGGIPIEPDSADAACFTRSVDWWPNERQMIEWLAEEDREGVLDERARPALIGAVRNAVEWVKPGGVLLFDHWTWERHREMDWFPWELFCNLIPLARDWIRDSDLPLKEISLEGRDPQWWMFFRNEK